jgi:mRNA interferase RelE/StbE
LSDALVWQIQFDPGAFADLKRLDREFQRRILRYLRQRIATSEDPRRFGKPLRGMLHGLWRYRLGDHRIVCQIREQALIVLVVRIAHRSKAYD